MSSTFPFFLSNDRRRLGGGGDGLEVRGTLQLCKELLGAEGKNLPKEKGERRRGRGWGWGGKCK